MTLSTSAERTRLDLDPLEKIKAMLYIFLQVGGVPTPVFWVAPALIVAIIVVLYLRELRKNKMKEEARTRDLRSHIINDSNYNIAREGIDGHRTEGMSADEAANVVEGLKSTDEIPSREEFNALRKDLKKS